MLVEESSQPPSLERFCRPSIGNLPRVEVPATGRALDIGPAKAAVGRQPFLYRDDLLEFDRGGLSRAAQTVENCFGEPVRFGGLSLIDCSSQSHRSSCTLQIFFENLIRNRILCQSHTFSVDWTVTIETEGDQIVLTILACVAAKLCVVDLKVCHGTAQLTAPAISA